MNEKYLKYDMATVFRDTTKGGLLLNFLRDYKKHFNTGKLNPSCSSCRLEYWRNYINLFKNKEMEKSKYILKLKYNGINLGATGQPIRNGEMTDKQAEELIKNHPKGKDLFDFIPEPKIKPKAKKKTVSKTEK